MSFAFLAVTILNPLHSSITALCIFTALVVAVKMPSLLYAAYII